MGFLRNPQKNAKIDKKVGKLNIFFRAILSEDEKKKLILQKKGKVQTRVKIDDSLSLNTRKVPCFLACFRFCLS